MSILKYFLYFALAIILLGGVFFAYLYLSQSKNLNEERVQNSPHFKEGSFHNFEPITLKQWGFFEYILLLKDIFLSSKFMPKKEIVSLKNDLKKLPRDEEVLVWFGHSSYLIQTSNKRFLIDPVLKSNASPSFLVKPFKGSDIYGVEDLCEIDYLIITHDHYDHLSQSTISKLAESQMQNLQKVIVPLGVGKYLRDFGIDESKIVELDWGESLKLNEDLTLNFVTSRHYSSRNFWNKSKTLWGSYVLKSKDKQIFMSGDTGYGKHFKEIGDKFGKIDLVIMENGQYNEDWRNVHIFPSEALKATQELNSKHFMPIHNSKFKIALHEWNAPHKELSEAAKSYPEIALFRPKIGEIAPLWDLNYIFEIWWE